MELLVLVAALQSSDGEKVSSRSDFSPGPVFAAPTEPVLSRQLVLSSSYTYGVSGAGHYPSVALGGAEMALVSYFE